MDLPLEVVTFVAGVVSVFIAAPTAAADVLVWGLVIGIVSEGNTVFCSPSPRVFKYCQSSRSFFAFS